MTYNVSSGTFSNQPTVHHIQSPTVEYLTYQKTLALIPHIPVYLVKVLIQPSNEYGKHASKCLVGNIALVKVYEWQLCFTNRSISALSEEDESVCLCILGPSN